MEILLWIVMGLFAVLAISIFVGGSITSPDDWEYEYHESDASNIPNDFVTSKERLK